MTSPRDHASMIEFAAMNQGLRLQRAKLDGWGPPEADSAARRRERAPRRDYAVKTPRSSRAVRAVFSAVIPSFSRTSAPGALAPKRSIDTVRSTQRSHP
jgi:hypothetical protein